MNKVWCFVFLLYISSLGAVWDDEIQYSSSPTVVEGYFCPVDVPEDVWQIVQPYLLPEELLLKKTLDRLFSRSRVIADRESLRAAGFRLTPDQGLHVVVAFHEEMKGYLIKVVLDKYDPNNNGKGKDWQQWIQRIEGERYIRNAIADLNYKKYFKVPRQWIYPLPPGPECPEIEDYFPKGFILIAEDMKLEAPESNTKFYRKMPKKILDAIYVITTKYGLSDCCNKHNLPFCKDGKLAFVDTESFNKWPVDYHRMVEFLSSERRIYWNTLRQQGGPK